MGIIEYYHLQNQYEILVTMVKQLAPPGLTEVWGVVEFDGGHDFRLNLDKYRVIELAPMARRIAVFMEWRKVFRQPEVYADDPDFHLFEDAFGYLGVNDNWNQPWNVWAETDISDPYVSIFLESGMRLMVKEICRMHPETRSIELTVDILFSPWCFIEVPEESYKQQMKEKWNVTIREFNMWHIRDEDLGTLPQHIAETVKMLRDPGNPAITEVDIGGGLFFLNGERLKLSTTLKWPQIERILEKQKQRKVRD